jgi:hypothetical protein
MFAIYLVYARPVNDQCIRDNEVESFGRLPIGGLTHAFTYGLAWQCLLIRAEPDKIEISHLRQI